MPSCIGALSEWTLTTCCEPSSSAAARRAAFPPQSHPHPTPPLERVGEPPSAQHAYHTLPDGRTLYWQQLLPTGKQPRAIVVLFHGFEDHSDFYMYNIARIFVEYAHCLALLVDLPGHGLSDGLHALLPSWGGLLDDLEHWCDTVCRGAAETHAPPGGPRLPLFAYGGSLGGAVVTGLASRSPERFAGAMLIAPMVRIGAGMRPAPPVEWLLRNVIARVPVLNDVQFVKRTLVPSVVFCSTEQWRQHEHEALDKLAYQGDTRLRTGATLLGATDELAKRMEQMRTPFLVMHGTADVVTSHATSQELHERAGAADKSIELLEGCVHMLDHGEAPAVHERVFSRLFGWLNERIGDGFESPPPVAVRSRLTGSGGQTGSPQLPQAAGDAAAVPAAVPAAAGAPAAPSVPVEYV